MRAGLSLLLVLVLTAIGHAKEEQAPKAPDGRAARAATLALIAPVYLLGETAREELANRYVDIDGIADRVFGTAVPKAGSSDAKAFRTSLVDYLSHKLVRELLRTKESAFGGGLHTEVTAAGLRAVHVPTTKNPLVLVWRNGKPAPMVVDFGHAEPGLVVAVLQGEWKLSTTTPSVFLDSLTRREAKVYREANRWRFAPKIDIVECKDNLRTIVMIMIARRTERVTGRYPPYSGKNFVLSLVATNQLDRRNKQNLEVLFSPGDKERSVTDAAFKRFKDVTKKALKAGTDFSDLTSYAGRRNAEQDFLITPDQEKMGTPLVADLSFPDLAIVGFSDGSVREMSREDLGLGPDDPIVVGDASKSELLRKLSDM